jgi:nitroreductase
MDDKNFFLNRRTYRQYANEVISDEIIGQMLTEASHAPTTGNMQLYSVVTTRSQEGKEKLSPAHFNQPSVKGCDVVLTFCADFNRFVHWCEVSGAIPGYDNFQSFMTAVLDVTIFAQQFCTIAEMRGYGCCYLGTTTYNAPQIADALNLPKRVVPVITITLGVPMGDAPKSDRLPLDAILHEEVYQDYTEDQIKRLYAEKEAREDSKRFVEENNKQSLAQVFTDVRYTKQANETFSKIYLDFIRNSKFEF